MDRLTRLSGEELIRRAVDLANAASDGAGDEEVTPSEIAGVIREALEVLDGRASPEVAQRLHDALDAVSDGMPPDYTARLLYGALQGWPLG